MKDRQVDPEVVPTTSEGTRDAVETAIEIAKGDKTTTWDARIRKAGRLPATWRTLSQQEPEAPPQARFVAIARTRRAPRCP